MKLRFVSPQIVGTGETVVELDGVSFTNSVRALRFDARAGDVMAVEIDVLLREGLTFEGDVSRIDVPAESAALLRRAGWLPPLHALGMLPPDLAERLRELHREYSQLASQVDA